MKTMWDNIKTEYDDSVPGFGMTPRTDRERKISEEGYAEGFEKGISYAADKTGVDPKKVLPQQRVKNAFEAIYKECEKYEPRSFEVNNVMTELAIQRHELGIDEEADMAEITKQIKELAERIAKTAHHCQIRWDDTPYINHPKRVASTFEDDDCIIIAWLHDVLEDTHLTSQDLINQGIPKKLVNSIENLTKKPGENYHTFIMRVAEDPVATRVKIADIEDNINDGLKEGTLKDKYRLAKHILRSTLYG